MLFPSVVQRLTFGAFFVAASLAPAQRPHALTSTRGFVRDPAIAALLPDVDPKRIRLIDSMPPAPNRGPALPPPSCGGA
jgi:hypothetical protein